MTIAGPIDSPTPNSTLTAHAPTTDVQKDTDVAMRAAALKRVPDDKDMLRAVAELTRDLGTPNPRIFWSDFLASAFLGYTGLAVAILSSNLWLQCAAALVSVLALYRAGLAVGRSRRLPSSPGQSGRLTGTGLATRATDGAALAWHLGR